MKQRVVGRIATAVCVLAIGAMTGGCPPGKPVARDMPLPPPPLRVPMRQAMPLDPALRQSARDIIMAGLSDPKQLTKAHSLEALSEVANVDPNGPDYSPMVVKLLNDDSELVRFSAALTVGHLKLQPAHAVLLANLNDPSKKVRVAVRYALHMLGDKRHSHDLEDFARDDDATVRGATAEVLGMMKEPSAIKLLRPMRLDKDPRVCQQAAAAMWMLGDEDGRNDLTTICVSNFPDDRMIALLALAEPRNTEVRETLRANLTTEWLEVNLVAARGMGMLGSDEGYPIALKGAVSQPDSHEQPPQMRVPAAAHRRFLAALALGAIGRSDAQPVLAKLLEDPSAAVRVAAATAILQLQN